MNIREGLRRLLVIAVVPAEVGWAIYVANNTTRYNSHTDDLVAWILGALAIPVIAFGGWKACDWIIRGFRNSD